VVICQCFTCGIRHLIADNKGLMDDSEFGRGNLEQYLAAKGESGKMQKGSMPGLDVADMPNFDFTTNEDGILEISRKADALPAPSA
jgi:DNL zinc finger